MKIKNLLVIGASLMLFGGLLAGITYALGAEKSMTWDHGPKLIEMVSKKEQIDEKKIKNLVIHAENQAIEIRRGLNFEVKTTYVKGYEPKITITNDTLAIKGAGSDRHVQVSFGDTSEKIIITIPREKKLSEVKVESTDGSLEIEGINSEKFQAESYNTWLDLSELTGETLTLNQEDSHIEAEHLDFSDMRISSNDASINMENLKLRKASTIDVSDGQVELENINVPGFTAQIENGHLYYNEREIHEPSYKQGNQEQALTININDGYLTINNDD